MKNLLLIKTDHIGDYILFRNFIDELKKSEKYKGYNIVFLTNERTKEIVEFLDNDVFFKIIYIDPKKYDGENWYSYRKNQEILNYLYDTVVNCTFGVYKFIENIVNIVDCRNKIIINDGKERPYIDDKNDDRNIKKIIINDKIFEFYRQKKVFETLLESKIELEKPYIKLKKSWLENIKYKNYIICFIGAYAVYRKFSEDKWIELIKRIFSNYDVNILLCGGREDKENAKYIQQNINDNRLYDLTAETTLVDMLYLCKSALCTISNDTSIAHISAVQDKKTIVLSNGNDFGKFSPYPKEFVDYKAIYPFDANQVEKYIDKFYSNKATLNINDILVQDIIDALEKLLPYTSKNIQKYSNTEKQFILSREQSAINYVFSSSISYCLKELENLRESDSKYLIYGDTKFASMVKLILKDKVVGTVDRSSKIIQEVNLHKNITYSPDNIKNFQFDKILICVLGRENEIYDALMAKYQIKKDEIIVLNIMKTDYINA